MQEPAEPQKKNWAGWAVRHSLTLAGSIYLASTAPILTGVSVMALAGSVYGAWYRWRYPEFYTTVKSMVPIGIRLTIVTFVTGGLALYTLALLTNVGPIAIGTLEIALVAVLFLALFHGLTMIVGTL